MLQVLGRPASINVRRVLWTGAELALPCDLQPWGRGPDAGARSIDSAAFLAPNPNAMTPMTRPGLPALAACHERLLERPGYRLHGANGTP